MIGSRFKKAFSCLVLAAVAAAMVITLEGCKRHVPAAKTLKCHVGGTMRPVMEKLAEMFEAQAGVEVEINSAGSGELLVHIESQKEGDLYVSHDPFLNILMTRGLGADGWTVAALTPVIVVRKGNPKKISNLADCLREDVSLVLTDYKLSTLGWMLPTIFRKAGLDFEKVKDAPNIQTFRKGGQAANLVKTGNADAAVVWNAVAHLRTDGLDVVTLPAEHLPTPGVDTITTATKREYVLAPVRVTIATLACSKNAAGARQFAEFVASPKAQDMFKSFGFTVIPAEKNYQAGKAISNSSAE